jgi:hypothetical protein
MLAQKVFAITKSVKTASNTETRSSVNATIGRCWETGAGFVALHLAHRPTDAEFIQPHEQIQLPAECGPDSDGP